MPGTRAVHVATGPSGTDVSHDGGRAWAPLEIPGFDALSFVPGGVGWASGQGGRLARIDVREEP